MGAITSSPGDAALNLITGGIAGAIKNANKPGGQGGAAGLLSILTAGTSEIKTGGGLYGDETVADTLFPKAINDVALTDRANARKATDKAEADKKDALYNSKPPPVVDLSDVATKTRKNEQLLKMLRSSSGRSGTFGMNPLGS
jgi:hypothetical protein